MRNCSLCKKSKEDSEFSLKGKTKLGIIRRSSACKECHRGYNKHHYNNNKKYYYDRNVVTKIKSRLFIDKVKETNSCYLCEKFYNPVTMDFHHIDDKHKEISLFKRGASIKTIINEIIKCILLCANCHRLVTFAQVELLQPVVTLSVNDLG